MIGTSIGDLNQKDQHNHYDNMRNLQDINNINYNTGQNVQYDPSRQMYQAQPQLQYHNMPNNNNYNQFPGQNIQPNQNNQNNQYSGYIPQKQSRIHEITDIEELAKDISDNLNDDTYASVSESIEEQTHSNSGVFSSIPEILREPMLIVILFVILSQPIVKETLGKYITQLNPDIEGKFSLTAIIIYAVILATLFAVIKKILF